MMLSPLVSGLVLVAFGAGVLAVAWYGHREGVVPAGPNFFKGRWMPSRSGNPVAFHLFLAMYFAGGITLCVWGLLAFLGMAPPLRLA